MKTLLPKKKDFKKVCQACMNGDRISRCPSETCLLAPIKDRKRFRGGRKILKMFCKSCYPEGYSARVICRTMDGCPLEGFYNQIWGKKEIKGIAYVQN